jgi:hypothetical protein
MRTRSSRLELYGPVQGTEKDCNGRRRCAMLELDRLSSPCATPLPRGSPTRQVYFHLFKESSVRVNATYFRPTVRWTVRVSLSVMMSHRCGCIRTMRGRATFGPCRHVLSYLVGRSCALQYLGRANVVLHSPLLLGLRGLWPQTRRLPLFANRALGW